MILLRPVFSQSGKFMPGNATPIVETAERHAINFRKSY
jgi:hypothetical protein